MLKLSRVILLLLAVFAIAALPQQVSATAKNCLFYEPGVVTVKGQLHRGVSTWMLELEKPVCIEGHEGDKTGSIYPTMDEVKTIIFWSRKDESADKYMEYLNKDVVVSGTLHHKSSDSGVGQIMIMVSDIAIAKPGDPAAAH